MAFSLSPSETLWRQIVNASQAISDEFYNQNEIDDKTFPPHLSLHICTIPTNSVSELQNALSHLWAASKELKLNITGVVAGTSGYVFAGVERTDDLQQLHTAIIECAAEARLPMRSPSENESNTDRYGNDYVLDRFEPHFSIAKVDFDEQRDAVDVAKRIVTSGPSEVRALELVDIDVDNSKWEVLSSSIALSANVPGF